MAIAYAVLKKQIDLSLLEIYLKDFPNKGTTEYNRLLVLYDYLKYK